MQTNRKIQQNFLHESTLSVDKPQTKQIGYCVQAKKTQRNAESFVWYPEPKSCYCCMLRTILT